MLRSDSTPQDLLPTTRIGRKGFLEADVGNKHVLMNIEHGVYIGLDNVGTGIWNSLATPQTIIRLCEHLRTVYQVSDQTVFERDVFAFIESLRLYGLVEIVP